MRRRLARAEPRSDVRKSSSENDLDNEQPESEYPNHIKTEMKSDGDFDDGLKTPPKKRARTQIINSLKESEESSELSETDSAEATESESLYEEASENVSETSDDSFHANEDKEGMQSPTYNHVDIEKTPRRTSKQETDRTPTLERTRDNTVTPKQEHIFKEELASSENEAQFTESDEDEPLAMRQARDMQAKRATKPSKPKISMFHRRTQQLAAVHPELSDVWDRLRREPSTGPVKKAAQPAGISMPLLPFQREGLYWLQSQEASQWRGGLLADEMGMGKTIQMVSLLVADPKRPNLVVAPTVAILQWRNEMQKYAKDLKVVVWHGAQRTQDAKKLADADVVMTSYSVLENAYRKMHHGFQRRGRRVKEPSLIHGIQWRRVILDEAHHIKERTTNTAKSAFALQSDFHWCLSGTPLQNRVGELYSMIRFLGGDPFSFYFCRECKCKSHYWRFTGNRSCNECHHKPMSHCSFWNFFILRPIQRDGTDRGDGQIAFAHLRLLLNHIMLRRTKLERADDMGLPPRTVQVRRDLFNDEEEELYQSLYTSTTRKFSTYLDQGTLLNNYSNIFSLLTRMRQMANHPDLVLRSNTGAKAGLVENEEVNVCKLCTEEAEDAVSSRCHHVFCRACITQYIESVEGDYDETVRKSDIVPDCPYCHATLSIDLDQPALEPPAPVRVHGESQRQGILSRLNLSQWRSSTKIEALVEELTLLRELPDRCIKSLVFSQFVNFLDLIAFRLQRAGFRICRLEGNMTPEARDRTIRHFMENPGVTVFLVSLKAGGVALNLTEASRVYLMDPWWNPAVEVQAMDRIHRLGQHRPIVVKRMIIENSIESRIIELQNKKSAMIEAAIGNDESAMGRLSVDDLRFLFTL
ncbi:DNA repair protein rad16 [Malassezia yamatoensis]|uniref:DNA repair protein rad16 n=1 Tax=Malassezia yamatoensis TaxID=253288 RepID=A0AAJ5YPY8_9BASI|nr:DNA repair protein rad16 [Malassezia yamatoensis]